MPCRVPLFACAAVLFAASSFLVVSAANGQASTVGLDRQSTNTTGIDNIDLGTLNVHIDLPLYSIKGRGNGTDRIVKLTYDSAFFDGTTTTPRIGWRIGPSTEGSLSTSQVQPLGCDPTDVYPDGQNTLFYWIYTDSDGVGHSYSGSTYLDTCNGFQQTSTLNELPDDQSPFRLVANGGNAYIVLPSGGTVSTNSPTFQDSNGNVTDKTSDTL